MQIRLILCLMLITGLSLGSSVQAQENSTSNLLKISDEMIQTTARLRGLEPKAPIQTGVKNKEEISRYLNERLEAEYSREDLRKEGTMLRELGLIPADMDYRDFIIKLLTEQVGGFYDAERKIFYIASWLPAEEQKPVMVHELTHALQDQHFDVERILKEDRESQNDDRTLAHQALLEGDGMVVMLQYLLEPIKRHFSQLPDLAFIMQSQMLTMQSQYPMFKIAPSYLRETLLFSYGYGSSFLQYSWNRNPSWQAVDKVYSDLPASTEQIMHPEKYFVSRDEPKTVTADSYAAAMGDSWKVAYKNVMGEFSLGLLLNLHLTEEHSRKATTGWGGDQVLLLENELGKNAVLLNTVWDTADDAEKFFAAMNEWFRRHYPDVQRSDETPAGFSVIKDGEISLIRHDGPNVRFIIGLPEADAPKLKNF
ncbi:MAG: hypothetical protein JXA73_13940 [Acidobacteria bacterium]|nr:hypothetical protein [Acidobacteriota bacterium]